jgi:hypothetical protein
MAASRAREETIRAAWKERGKAQWDPNTHGRSLLSLHIPATVQMRPVRFGAPLPPYDDLEFRLVRATMGGQPINSIVCEDVVVENVEDSTPPSTSGPRNASPQQQPSQGLGMAGVTRAGAQGRATLTVTFPDKEAVSAWLKEQSDDIAVVFAARAALRVIPAITLSPWPGSARSTTPEIMLRAFRAVAAAWAVAACPGQRDHLNKAARAALIGLGDLNAPSPIRAVVYAAATASGEAGAATRASTVVGYALDAVGSKGRDAFDHLLQALATDAGILSDGFSAVTLANSQLWPGRPPAWVSADWGELRASLLDLDENWEVWTVWYDERLGGTTTNQDLEVARVLIEDNVWSQEPKKANAHIKLLLEERGIFQDALSDEPELPPNADAIPRQTGAASRFGLDVEGRIDLLPDAPLPDSMQRELYREVRYKAVALQGLGHNQLAEMSEPVSRFLLATPVRIEDVSITRLWSRGNSLRRRIKAHDTAVTSADPTDPAILSTSVAELLRDLVETYNVFIIGDPHGRELDQIRLGPRERSEATATVDLAATITEAVQVSEGVATAAAVDALVEQVEAARAAPAGTDGDQAIDLSRKTSSNFVIELLRSAYALLLAEPGFAWKEIRSGTYRYAVPGLIAGGYVPPVITFVVQEALNLKLFVEQAFHNPTLIQIIDVISRIGGAH